MTDDTRRHWHGSPGDRHEHHNVWVQGGPKSQTTRAAWALTPEMIANMQQRRGSDASTGSAGSGAANANANGNGAANAAPTLPSVAERRRSSAGSGTGLFSNLQSQKRESNNPEMETRRASWNEQQQKGGVFSKLWDEYTRGK